MPPAPIYVLTSDDYLPALRPFAWLLNKYWVPNPTVYVGGFQAPPFALPENFRFLTLGQMEDYPLEKWTNAALKLIDHLPFDIFIFMLEDYWITRPVDVDLVRGMTFYIERDPKLMRFDLTADRARAGDGNIEDYGNLGSVELIKSLPHSPYHMSLMPALWRRGLFKRIVQPDWTPWDVELEGTRRISLMSNPPLVLGTKEFPVQITLAFRGGDSKRILLDELNPDDVEIMRAQGLLEPWEEVPA